MTWHWCGQELEAILDRAASQLTGNKAVQVPEDVFWFVTQASTYSENTCHRPYFDIAA